MSRNWCWTSFKTEGCPITEKVGEAIRYLVYQKEKCPVSGREHLQGYIQFSTQKRLKGAKAFFTDPAVHMEVSRGTADRAREYCMKEDSRITPPVEEGVFCAGKGIRNDLATLAKKIEDKIEPSGVEWIRYHRGIQAYKDRLVPVRKWKTEVTILWGKTNLGKSRWVQEQAGPEAYWKMPDNKWWDGYEGQEVVVIDDIEWSAFGRSYLLNLWDRYPFRVERKGGSVQFAAKRLYITTNVDPNTILDTERLRRVDHLLHAEQVLQVPGNTSPEPVTEGGTDQGKKINNYFPEDNVEQEE